LVRCWGGQFHSRAAIRWLLIDIRIAERPPPCRPGQQFSSNGASLAWPMKADKDGGKAEQADLSKAATRATNRTGGCDAVFHPASAIDAKNCASTELFGPGRDTGHGGDRPGPLTRPAPIKPGAWGGGPIHAAPVCRKACTPCAYPAEAGRTGRMGETDARSARSLVADPQANANVRTPAASRVAKPGEMVGTRLARAENGLLTVQEPRGNFSGLNLLGRQRWSARHRIKGSKVATTTSPQLLLPSAHPRHEVHGCMICGACAM